MENFIKDIEKVIKQAGQIVLKAKEDNITADFKDGRGNIVTKYDKEVEKYLKIELKKILEDSSFIGEEGDFEDNNSTYKFIVDPIDGTYNFYEDFNESAISVGILKNNKPYIGLCYNPYKDEMYVGQVNEGAYLNEKRIHVSNKHLKDGIFFSGSASYYSELKDKTISNYSKLWHIANDYRRLGSAVIEICYVASGKAELFIEERLQPRDYTAASIILKEAGGKITDLDGNELTYDKQSSVIAHNNTDDYIKYL